MKLELVPIENETRKVLSEEERAHMRKRIRQIQPEELAHFSEADRREIKTFIAKMIGYSEIIHHDLEDVEHLGEHEARIEWGQEHRKALINEATPAVADFIKIVDVSAAEPWLEWEVLIDFLRREEKKRYYDTMNRSGTRLDINNPYLAHVDDHDEKHQDELGKTRLTMEDIGHYVRMFSIEDMVRFLIESRKVITGEFWVEDYDL